MNSKNIKSLLFVAGTALSLLIFAVNFTACSSHILDMTEGLQSASTPTQPASTPETTPPPESTPTPTPAPTPTAHSITVTSGEHGTISVDKTNAAEGETVTITVTPEADYILDVLTITDSSGNAIAISAAKTFTMPESDVTVSGTFKFARLVMLSGPSINTILNQNNVRSIVTKFIHSATPPETGIVTYKLSADNSDVDVLAWLDGTTIKFYAEGYTDSNRKIPLNADSKLLFISCSSLQVIDTEVFDTAAVTDMRSMFSGCVNLTTLNLSGFDTAAVTDMRYMFFNCNKLETIVFPNKFLTSNVKAMAWMFDGCESLTSLDLSSFDTSNVTDMKYMFNTCKKLETIVFSNKFLTSNVKTIDWMFHGCESLTSLDLSSFDTSNVTDMKYMFSSDYSLTTIFVGDGFDTSNVTRSRGMFGTCLSLVGGVGTTFSYSYPEDKTYARIDDPANGNPGYFTRK